MKTKSFFLTGYLLLGAVVLGLCLSMLCGCAGFNANNYDAVANAVAYTSAKEVIAKATSADDKAAKIKALASVADYISLGSTVATAIDASTPNPDAPQWQKFEKQLVDAGSQWGPQLAAGIRKAVSESQ